MFFISQKQTSKSPQTDQAITKDDVTVCIVM